MMRTEPRRKLMRFRGIKAALIALTLLAGCVSPTSPREPGQPVVGIVKLDEVFDLMALPGYTNALTCEPEWTREALRRVARLQFLIELQPLR